VDFKTIIYESGDRKAFITLNRPQKRNALDDVMVGELTSAFTLAAKDPAVKVIILGAAGPAFCAGADLEYLAQLSKYDLEENRADSYRLANLLRFIYEIRKPVVAVVNGPALAGGCGLATVCDFVLASKEHARFGYTEVHIGFLPAIVMVFLIKRIGEGRARELVIRGNILDAEEAHAAGLATVAVQEAELQAVRDSLLEELLTANSLASMGLCKEMLSKLQGMNLVDALDFAVNMNAAMRMTAECKQGVRAFLEGKHYEW
jgi:methylglutaconyl-CoA hydratase